MQKENLHFEILDKQRMEMLVKLSRRIKEFSKENLSLIWYNLDKKKRRRNEDVRRHDFAKSYVQKKYSYNIGGGGGCVAISGFARIGVYSDFCLGRIRNNLYC